MTGQNHSLKVAHFSDLTLFRPGVTSVSKKPYAPVSRHAFPVTSPVISLLVPCYDFKPEAIYSSVCEETNADRLLSDAKFPVFFPVNGNSGPETG